MDLARMRDRKREEQRRQAILDKEANIRIQNLLREKRDPKIKEHVEEWRREGQGWSDILDLLNLYRELGQYTG